MYNENDWWAYLAHYNHNHDAAGRFAPSGTGRYYRLTSKYSKNAEKIEKYQNKLNSNSGMNRDVKAAKYKAKQDKLDAKAAKARKKLVKGKELSDKEMKRIAKADSNQAKLSKTSEKNDAYRAKISKLEAKNAKIDKKLDKMVAKDEHYREVELLNIEAQKSANKLYGKAANRKGATNKANQSNAQLNNEAKVVKNMSVSELREERRKANLIGITAGTATNLAQLPLAAVTGSPVIYDFTGTYKRSYKSASRKKRMNTGGK